MNYTRPGKDNSTDAPRILQITKNRVNGMLTFEGIPLYYEIESKRITESKFLPRPKKYGWETEADEWLNAEDVPEEIPF